MDYMIREMKEKEYPLLRDFLYEAIYVPDGLEAPPRQIINIPELQVYIEDFGKRRHDRAYVAEKNGNIIGAVWVRIMNDYGHIDEETPSFAISLYKQYRGHGVGTALMKQMIYSLRACGYEKASLAVQKANYAVRMYQNVGFEIVDESDQEYFMINYLQKDKSLVS